MQLNKSLATLESQVPEKEPYYPILNDNENNYRQHKSSIESSYLWQMFEINIKFELIKLINCDN